MQTHDSNVPTSLLFRVAMITVLAAGIGCDGKSSSKDAGPADAGKDVAVADGSSIPDVSAPDTARGDGTQTTDTSKSDTPPVSPDLPPFGGSMGDCPTQTDVPSGIDARVDAPSVDSAEIDVADALAASDALATTQARITFAFKNTGTQVVYLQTECALAFQVVSEVTATVYPNKSICLCQCADPICQDEPNCAPCAPRSGIAVEPGTTREATWTAQTSTIKDKTGTRGTFKCLENAPIPTGAYRVTIPVFSSAADAAANTNATSASLSFQLTTANAKIEVPLR